MRVVIDTNVLVSALINPDGPPATAIGYALAGVVTVLYDAPIVEEYREVLARPKFSFDPVKVEAVLAGLLVDGQPVDPRPVAVSLPDPSDLPFVEVAVAGRADVIVTGNASHFPGDAFPKGCGVRVVSPKSFVRELENELGV